jgi:nucleotide-binding universal stress UspA family protein
MYSRMLVPFDGSEPSKRALEEAIKLAQSMKASVCLLHVVDIWPLLTSPITAAGYDPLFDAMRRDGARLLRDAAAEVSKAGIKVETFLVDSPDVQVGECIVRKASEYEAGLIICGTHGRRGVRRLLMGSDAEYIVRHSPVPVLLVRARDADEKNSKAAVSAAA